MTSQEYKRFLKDLKVGDVLRFADITDGNDLDWNPTYVKETLKVRKSGLKILVTEDLKKRLVYTTSGLRAIFGEEIFSQMEALGCRDWRGSHNFLLEIEDGSRPIQESQGYTFDTTDKEDIIKEMISKVDFQRFVSLMSVVGSNSVPVKRADENVCMEYLKRWAEAKWRFYVLFGRELFATKSIELEMSKDTMSQIIDTLGMKFPKYAETLYRIGPMAFIKNSMENTQISHEYEFLTNGMKATKFLSLLYNDKKFNDEVSVSLDIRKIKSNLRMSIDPYDFCTCSISTIITSCQRITDGEYFAGGISLMLDPSTAIQYVANDEDVKHSRFGEIITGNNKSWRRWAHVDFKNFSIINNRQYPHNADMIANAANALYQETVDTFLGNRNKWSILKRQKGDYHQNGSFFWMDGVNSEDRFMHIANLFDESMDIEIGTSYLYSVYTGKQLRSPNGRRLVGGEE